MIIIIIIIIIHITRLWAINESAKKVLNAREQLKIKKMLDEDQGLRS